MSLAAVWLASLLASAPADACVDTHGSPVILPGSTHAYGSPKLPDVQVQADDSGTGSDGDGQGSADSRAADLGTDRPETVAVPTVDPVSSGLLLSAAAFEHLRRERPVDAERALVCLEAARIYLPESAVIARDLA
ncbi:MAG: hypothetical protein AAFN74_24140, partial [Myxococcota bacterium]